MGSLKFHLIPLTVYVLGKSMFEHIDQFRKQRFLINQLSGLELLQIRLSVVVQVHQPVQQATGELSADDSRQLQGLFGRLRQAVDARHEHILDGIGDTDIAEFSGHDIPPTFTPNSTDLA